MEKTLYELIFDINRGGGSPRINKKKLNVTKLISPVNKTDEAVSG
jgi:hypothetical protein